MRWCISYAIYSLWGYHNVEIHSMSTSLFFVGQMYFNFQRSLHFKSFNSIGAPTTTQMHIESKRAMEKGEHTNLSTAQRCASTIIELICGKLIKLRSKRQLKLSLRFFNLNHGIHSLLFWLMLLSDYKTHTYRAIEVSINTAQTFYPNTIENGCIGWKTISNLRYDSKLGKHISTFFFTFYNEI